MIELKNVTKRYLNKTAIDDISITFPTGKIIALVGENGSGKSTTLKLIAGLIKPSKGIVEVDENVVDRRISNIVSYLSELDAYYSFYSVQETINFFATQFDDFDIKKANMITEFMKLDPHKKVKHLSKGNRGRLKILLSLSRNVPYILMDEPFSGLDPMVRDSIVKGLISFIDSEKQTLIITTHEIKEVEPLLDIVIVLQNGKIVKVADVEELRYEENLSVLDLMKKIYE